MKSGLNFCIKPHFDPYFSQDHAIAGLCQDKMAHGNIPRPHHIELHFWKREGALRSLLEDQNISFRAKVVKLLRSQVTHSRSEHFVFLISVLTALLGLI